MVGTRVQRLPGERVSERVGRLMEAAKGARTREAIHESEELEDQRGSTGNLMEQNLPEGCEWRKEVIKLCTLLLPGRDHLGPGFKKTVQLDGSKVSLCRNWAQFNPKT